MTMPGTWLTNNHHLPMLELQNVLDTSLFHSHNSSAFFYPRGFPEPSPTSSSNLQILPLLSQGHWGQEHNYTRGCLRDLGSQLLLPTASLSHLSASLPRPSASLTWTAATPTDVPCRCPLGIRQAAASSFGGIPSHHNLLRPPLTWLDHPHLLPS